MFSGLKAEKIRKAELAVTTVASILLIVSALTGEAMAFNAYFPRIHDEIIDEALQDLDFSPTL